jgi:hypothetical protein
MARAGRGGPAYRRFESLEVYRQGFSCKPQVMELGGVSRPSPLKGFLRFSLRDPLVSIGKSLGRVGTIDLLKYITILSEVRFVLVHAYDSGWTTNMPLNTFLVELILAGHTTESLFRWSTEALAISDSSALCLEERKMGSCLWNFLPKTNRVTGSKGVS